jgi:hypothetical protein
MTLSADQVANAEIYRWGVDEAAGLAVKYVAKLAASAMFSARSAQSLLFLFSIVS